MNALKLGLFALAAATALSSRETPGRFQSFNRNSALADRAHSIARAWVPGLLTLDNYTLGTPITFGEFVSFGYHSNILDLLITQADLNFIIGSIVGPLPRCCGQKIVDA